MDLYVGGDQRDILKRSGKSEKVSRAPHCMLQRCDGGSNKKSARTTAPKGKSLKQDGGRKHKRMARDGIVEGNGLGESKGQRGSKGES